MALDTKEITIDDLKFSIQQFPALKAMKIEKKLMEVLIPVMGSLISEDKKKHIDMAKVSLGIQTGLSSLTEEKFEDVILSSLSSTYAYVNGKPEIINIDIFNQVFTGKILTVYKLILEVMKVNKFCFFELLRGGNGTNLTAFFSNEK